MKFRCFVRVLVIAILSASQQGYGRSGYPFQIDTQRVDAGYRLVAINRGPAPVSVRVDLTGQENFASDVAWPIYVVVPATATAILAHVHAAKTDAGFRFSSSSTFVVGDYTALPDDSVRYRVPFADGNRFVISQAADGPLTTHTTPDSRNAIDISMPEGAPIVAARDGVVVESDGSHTAGGTDTELLGEANLVRIAHDDGTVANYAHLAAGGVYVQPGQRVLAGAIIGLAGSTGYSSGPHLHFAVTQVVRTEQGMAVISVPVMFTVGRPAYEFAPRTGLLVYATYTAPTTPTQLERNGDKFLLLRDSSMPASRLQVELPPPESLSARVWGALGKVPWWHWAGLLVSAWLLALTIKWRRARIAAAAPNAPPGRSRAVSHSTALTPRERLILACGGDRDLAARLMVVEHRASQTMTNDEAAQRAWERLMRERQTP